jgi:hypothetical protein
VMMNQWLVWWTGNEFHEKIDFWFAIYDGIGFGVAGLMSGHFFCCTSLRSINLNVL